MPNADTLLDFWFGELTEGIAKPQQRKRWFAPDANFDAQCTDLFGSLLPQAKSSALNSWLDTRRGRLAFIILTDQITRNVYRGTAEAYAWDELALAAAREGIKQGADRTLAWDERSFFYMPFEHTEGILEQHIAVGLFSNLRDESPSELRNITGNNLRFAHQHRDIILRFGRFPHRNKVLGRTSTAEEAEFVGAGDGFGQNPN